jgi:hypothetical protein
VPPGPLHGPPTFADWLRTCRVELALAGLPAEVTAEAEPDGLAATHTVALAPGGLLAPPPAR